MPEDFVKAAEIGDLSPGDKKLIQIEDEYFTLVNSDGTYYALDAECSHAYALMSYGQLHGGELMCPLHGAMFDVKTGDALSAPATRPLTVYPVKVEGNDILIGPPD